MDPQTVRTINDFFNLAGRVIIYCGGIAGAIACIWALVEKIRSKGWKAATDKRLTNLEVYSQKDNDRLKKLEDDRLSREDEIKDLHEVSRLTLSAVQELLKSSLDNGSNHAGMEDASAKIDEYLKSKI